MLHHEQEGIDRLLKIPQRPHREGLLLAERYALGGTLLVVGFVLLLRAFT